MKQPNQQEVKFADEDISPIQHAPREIRAQKEDYENLGTDGMDSMAQTNHLQDLTALSFTERI